MFKPTKKQHVVNKAYADQNGGSGGGENSLYIVDVLDGEKNGHYAQIFNKTFKDVYDAFMAGKIVLLSEQLEGFPAGSYNFHYVSGIGYNGEAYAVGTSLGGSYSADDYNDFPYFVSL